MAQSMCAERRKEWLVFMEGDAEVLRLDGVQPYQAEDSSLFQLTPGGHNEEMRDEIIARSGEDFEVLRAGMSEGIVRGKRNRADGRDYLMMSEGTPVAIEDELRSLENNDRFFVQEVENSVARGRTRGLIVYVLKHRVVATPPAPQQAGGGDGLYDAFVCHASADKTWVKALVAGLSDAGFRVWYDETSIGWGASVSGSIDKGLASSSYGIVVLSPAFMTKAWTAHEVSGLVQKKIAERRASILPIYHGIDHDAIRSYSLTLADLNAVHSGVGIDQIVAKFQALMDGKEPELDRDLGKQVAPRTCRRPRKVVDGNHAEACFYHLSPYWADRHETGLYCAPAPYIVAGIRQDILDHAIVEGKVLHLRGLEPSAGSDGLVIMFQFIGLTDAEDEDLPCLRPRD